MRLAYGLVLLAGCGRVAFDARVDDVTADAGCTLGPWSAPRHQAALVSPGEDWEPAISPDGLVIVFASTRQGGPMKLYAATRASRGEDFANPRFLGELAGAPTVIDHGIAWSEDGSRIYYVQVPGTARVASHLGGGVFGNVLDVDLPGHNFAFSDDERELFYTTFDGDNDVHHARREGSGWVPDDLLAGYNRAGQDEGWPSYDDARDELYIEQTVDNAAVIRVASRTDEGFGVLTTVAALGSDSGDPDISPDGLEIAMSSRQAPSVGANDIFLATRVCQ